MPSGSVAVRSCWEVVHNKSVSCLRRGDKGAGIPVCACVYLFLVVSTHVHEEVLVRTVDIDNEGVANDREVLNVNIIIFSLENLRR